MTATSDPHMIYLAGYPERLSGPVRTMIAEQRLAGWLRQKYPQAHDIRSDSALYAYVDALKNDGMRNAGPLAKVCYDGKLQSVQKALGTHARIASVQGGRIKSRCEIRVAAVFREAPAAFLKMIVVHELAHLKEREHDKAFYALCCHMAPDYHQLEFDLRLYLTHLDQRAGPRSSSSQGAVAAADTAEAAGSASGALAAAGTASMPIRAT